MSLDKAIEHGKEKRKQYRGAKSIDSSCRNHGDCGICKGNRLYQRNKKDEAARQALEDFENEDDEQDKMIRTSRKANLSKEKLIETFESQGLIGVYNLGLKNMMDYLEEVDYDQ